MKIFKKIIDIKNKEKIYFIFPMKDKLSYCQSSESMQLINKYNSTTAPFLDYEIILQK